MSVEFYERDVRVEFDVRVRDFEKGKVLFPEGISNDDINEMMKTNFKEVGGKQEKHIKELKIVLSEFPLKQWILKTTKNYVLIVRLLPKEYNAYLAVYLIKSEKNMLESGKDKEMFVIFDNQLMKEPYDEGGHFITPSKSVCTDNGDGLTFTEIIYGDRGDESIPVLGGDDNIPYKTPYGKKIKVLWEYFREIKRRK